MRICNEMKKCERWRWRSEEKRRAFVVLFGCKEGEVQVVGE